MEFWDKRKKKRKNKDKNNDKEVLLQSKTDRRVLDNVPDKEAIRSNRDRRGGSLLDREENATVNDFIRQKNGGIRYVVDYDVKVSGKTKQGQKYTFTCKGIDISTTGILLEIQDRSYVALLENTHRVNLDFEILPGSMPEGYEMKVKQQGNVRRVFAKDDSLLVGVEFVKDLARYANHKKGRYDLLVASIFLFSISFFIILMRAESVIYFKFNKWLYLYSIIAAVFLLTRYLFSMFYRAVPIDPDFTPGVTIIIPCFNEEEWIQRTVLSCINQDYPVDKLEVIIVDDCSNDKSVEKVKEIMGQLYEEADRYHTKERLKCITQHKNAGKREALVLGVEAAKHDLVVFVDSDSFLDPFAIRNLVQPFKDPKMGGCAGRTDVANTYTNGLTKMQAVRYYIAFRVMKAAEGYFDTVSCLSGPLSCYRKEIIMENKQAWLQQKFLGQKATFGDDRSMTNFVLRKHRTTYQDTAICSTIVPSAHKVFLKQQMRWKRSWLRESLIAGGFMWKKEPFASLGFYMGLFVPIAAPIVVLYNLVYIPLTHHIFPTTFLVGILMMSLLMSMAQLLLRKSTTWIYGMLFCLYYEVVLLWQMPVAWVTFWKSTWGTRLTPSDLLAMRKKKGEVGAKGEETAGESGTGTSEMPGIEAGENVVKQPAIGFTVFTAFDSCYLLDDTSLTPMTAMTKNPEYQLNPVGEATEDAKAAETESTGAIEQEVAVAVAQASVPAPAQTEIAVAAVQMSMPAPEQTEVVQPTVVPAPEHATTKRTAAAAITRPTITVVAPEAATDSEAASDTEATFTSMITEQVKQSVYQSLIENEMSDFIAELSHNIADDIRRSVKEELETQVRKELEESIRAEVIEELKAELKKQILMDLLKK